MCAQTYFPISFMASANRRNNEIARGVYLRWFVKPYLGINGISPLHPSINNGFRLFCYPDREDIPDLTPLQWPDSILEDQHPIMTNVPDYPGWKAFYDKDKDKGKDLSFGFVFPKKLDIHYLRFSYRLYENQSLRFSYKTKRGIRETEHHISLNYPELDEYLGDRDPSQPQYENLTYAIHTDHINEYISEFRPLWNEDLLIGDFYYADSVYAEFYMWTPDGGKHTWEEIPTEDYMLGDHLHDLIRPIDPELMTDLVGDFYKEYYNVDPYSNRGGEISFIYPDLPQYQLGQKLIRRYIAEQYGKFCAEGIEYNPKSSTDLKISPQDTAVLVSNDPAIAYLFGLFRVLNKEETMDRSCIYKIQGTWPDGKRFCIYAPYKPGYTLEKPGISSLSASQKGSTRVLKDYKTFRVHNKLNVADISWKEDQSATPVGGGVQLPPSAYIILRSCSSPQKPQVDCLSEFFIPQDKDRKPSNFVHYVDWYDTYPGTDINKVLHGNYRYYVAGINVFGLLSRFGDTVARVNPAKLKPGEIQRPETALSRLPNPVQSGESDLIEIPLEVTEKGSTFQLTEYKNPNLTFDFSFFWPMESRYIWDKNRATSNPQIDSLGYFKLYYLVDIPLHCQAEFEVINISNSEIEVEIEQVKSNNPVYEMLKKLDVVSENGSLIEDQVNAVLNGGLLSAGRYFNIAKVKTNTSQSKISLHLTLDERTGQANQIRKIFYEKDGNRYKLKNGIIKGQLYWNVNATYKNTRIAWSSLSYVGEKITPTQPIDFASPFPIQNFTLKFLFDMQSSLKPEFGNNISYFLQKIKADFSNNGHPLSNNAKINEVSENKEWQISDGQKNFIIRERDYKLKVYTAADSAAFPNDLASKVGLECFDAPQGQDEDYYFTIHLPKSHPLANNNRFQLIPMDPANNLEPGEYKRPNPTENDYIDYPLSAGTLFDEDRIFAFYAVRAADDPLYPNTVIFRGDAIPFWSKDGSSSKQYMLCPDSNHAKWRVIEPNVLEKRQLPLNDFCKGRDFGQDNYLRSSLTVAVEAVVTGQDIEVEDSLQDSITTTKLSFVQYLPPPVLEIKEPPQPVFGIEAYPPGYNGESIISVDKIYKNHRLGIDYQLDAKLPDKYKYFLYKLPASQIINGGVPIKYAEDKGNIYRRNMYDLQQKLEQTKKGLDIKNIAESFKKYAQKVNESPLSKEDFLKLPVTLPGKSQAVYLFAIKVYNAKYGKESENFIALSPPVYVEDTTKPDVPLIKSSDVFLKNNTITIEFTVLRKLDVDNGYGYASSSELKTKPKHLEAIFPHYVESYRLYLSNDVDIVADPDDSDFASIEDPKKLPAKLNPSKFSIKLKPEALSIKQQTDEHIQLVTTLKFNKQLKLADKLRSRIYICLRGENYLGQLSEFNLIPHVIRESSPA